MSLKARIQEDVKNAMEGVLTDGSGCDSEVLRQQLMLTLHPDTGDRPDPMEIDRWESLLDGPADPDRGRRVFFSNTSLCATCHVMDGRGGDFGQDLSQVGKSKNRKGLISSIFRPSEEMSPEWQGWFIEMKDGIRHDGRQIDVGYSDIKLYTQSEGFIQVKKDDIADYGMSRISLMPEGLQHRLTNQDLRDLISYLESH